MWLETRATSLNEKDRRAVDAWRAQNIVGGQLRIDFAVPYGLAGEPLLWLPDLVAGAVSSALGDGDPHYLATIESTVTKVTIDLG